MWLKVFVWVLISLVCLYAMAFMLLYFLQEKLIFFPEKLARDHSFSFARPFSEAFLETPDGELINILHFIPDNPKGMVVYYHGNAGNLQGWGERCYPFYDAGFGCTIMDYRGYGKSSGKIDPENLFSDAELVLEKVQGAHPGLPIILYGASLGTGIASQLAAEKGCNALILETPYFNLGDVSSEHYPFLPHNLLLRYPMRTDLHIEKVSCPVYLFHGTEDLVINYRSSVKLQKKLGARGELITIEGGAHSNLIRYDEYIGNLNRILESVK